METFTINVNDLNDVISPLFYIGGQITKGSAIKLKDIAVINPHRKIGKLKLEENVPYVGLPETSDREIKEILLRPYREVKGRGVIKRGDILFARIEPSVFNKKYIFVDNLGKYDFAFTSTEFYIVEPKDDVDPKYLFNCFFFDSVFNQIVGKTTGTTGRRRLDKKVFENLLIPYPSREKRNEVAKLLDNAYKQKKLKDSEAQKLLDSINDYVIDELGIKLPKERDEKCFVVEYENIKIGRIDPDKFLHPPDTPKSNKYKERNLNKVAILTKGQSITKENIVSGDYPVIAGGQTSPYKVNRYNHEGDVITVSASGAYSGYVWYHKNPIFASDCTVIKSLDNNMCSTFYLYCIMKAKQNFIYNMQQGAGQPHVYSRDLSNLKIPLPPLSIQNKIAEEVKKRMQKAEQLQREVKEELEKAKKEVEKIILS